MAETTPRKDGATGGKGPPAPTRAEGMTPEVARARDPFFPLRGRWNRMFDELMKDFPSFPSLASFPAFSEWGKGGFPSLDMREKDEEILVTAEVPGVAAEELDVRIEGKLLTIRGEKTQETEAKEGEPHRVERVYGSFERQVVLPSPIDAEKVTAVFKDGVLTLHLPKRPEAKARKIQIG